MDSAAPWQEDPPGHATRRRWQLLVTLATVPWLVVAALLVRGGDADLGAASAGPTPAATAGHGHEDVPDGHGPHGPGGTPGPDAPRGPDDPHAPPGAVDAGPPTDEADPTAPPLVAPSPGAPATAVPPATTANVTDGDAATVATAVARAWLTDGDGPDLDGPDVPRTDAGYLEHVSVRRIEVLGPDRAVVTLGVLLLEREDDRYARVRAADLLVPLTLSADRAHPAGTPWWSPREVDLRPQPPEVDDDVPPAVTTEVVRALADAGYRDVQVAGVARDGDGLLVATVTGATATGRSLDGDVWLRETPDGPRVLGADP